MSLTNPAGAIAALVRHGPIIGALSDRPCPSWVTDGWYSNNASAQAEAKAHWSIPVSTAAERERAFRVVLPGESFPCTRCERFAFPSPRRCFWCKDLS